MNLDPFSGHGLSLSGSIGNKSSADKIFVKSKHGGLGRRSAPAEPGEPLEIPEAEPAPQEDKKEKVVLRNPKWEAEEVGFGEETDISVELQLPAEHANKKKVLFELYAKTPADPERISQAEGFEEGGKAKAKIPVYQPNFKDETGAQLTSVEYYFTAKHSQSDLLKDPKAVRQVDKKAARVIESFVLEDTTFDTDSSFLHPRNAPALANLKSRIQGWREKYPDGTLAVFGHTDAVGQESYNKGLSERRAKSVHAFLIQDVSVWEKLYGEEKWTLKQVQALLKHLGHDPGALDGVDGPKTQAAFKGFQEAAGLPVEAKNTANSRKGLFQAFVDGLNNLKLDKKVFEDINGNPFTGCSEFNLLEDTQGALEKNRRVTVLLLKSSKNFPVAYPCAMGNIDKCKAQVKKNAGKRRRASFKCCFYDELVSEEGGGGGAGGAVDLPDYDPCIVQKSEDFGCADEDHPLPEDEGAGPILNAAWNVEKARCGGTVKLLADSSLDEGTEVLIHFATAQQKCDEAKAKVKGGQIEFEWKVKGVGFATDKDKKFLPEVEVIATLEASGKKTVPEKPLLVQTVVEAKPAVFDKNYTWGIYGVHAHFTQEVKGRIQNVEVKKKVMKAWGATYVRVSDAGIKGSTADFPMEGHRWAKSTTGHMIPDLYWDGKAWKAIPDGVTDDPTTVGTMPLIKTGAKFHHPGSPAYVWPDALKDYEFDAAEYANKRKAWIADSNKRWSNTWKIKRKDCAADPKANCCTYDVALSFLMEKTETYDNDTLCLAPGNLRSNAGLFFYGETRIAMAGHEVGHLVGLPDEYPGGAVDPAATGDGLSAGIDSTTLMGGDMLTDATRKIKKRHYSNFLVMAKSIFKDAGGSEQEWVAIP